MRSSTLAVAAVMVAALLLDDVESSEIGVPLQFVYNETSSDRAFTDASGCKFVQWDGTDQNGVAGYPWITSIECPEGSSFEAEGIADRGHLRFFLKQGSLTANGRELTLQGDAYWMNEASFVELAIGENTFVYVVGAEFRLKNASYDGAHRSTSFDGDVTERYYSGHDAISGADALAANGHDGHIGNGTTSARDLVFSKNTTVDPPSVTVLNCAPQAESYVWYHTHPAGAMYIPYAGEICFDTDVTECIVPGEARWVSPNLFYKEHFNKLSEVDDAAQTLVKLAFAGNTDGDATCEHPVTFGVTNFDPDDVSGQPNFDDAPGGAFNQWGVFRTLIVRTTSIVTKTVSVGDRR